MFAALPPQVLTIRIKQLLYAVVASALQLPLWLCGLVCCGLSLIEPNLCFWLD